MSEWVRGGLQSAWTMGGLLVGIAPVLLLLLGFLLPKHRRHQLRAPAALFGFVVALIAVDFLAPMHWASRGMWVLGFGCLLFVIVRSILLFLTETRAGKALIPPLPKIVTDVVQAVAYLAAIMLTLHAAGMEPGSLLTTSALLTVVIGLALQDTLGNLFSGLALQMGRPFDVGDWVEIDREAVNAGRVVEVGWRATKIMTLDDVEVIVPNGMMARALLRNATRPTPVARRNIAFQAPYDLAPGDVRETALRTLTGLQKVLAEPPPSVLLVEFEESAIGYSLRYYTDDFPGAAVTDSEVRMRLWYGFRRAGISFPFPHRDVHLHVTEPEVVKRKAARERSDGLRRIPLFSTLAPDEIHALAAHAETRQFGSGEQIVVEGDAGDELYGLVRGRVRVSAAGVEVARLGEGEFFGEMSLLTREHRAATVEAVGPCTLVVVGHDALQHAFDVHPELVQRLSAAIAERQRNLDATLRAADTNGTQPEGDRATELLDRIRAFFQT